MKNMNKHLRLELGRKKARKVIRAMRNRFQHHPEWLDEDGDIFHRMIHTRANCSCAMCGNPRKYFGEVTRQEQVSDMDIKEWEQDTGNNWKKNTPS